MARHTSLPVQVGAMWDEQCQATSAAYIREIGEIFALGLMRVLARKSSGKKAINRESLLDFSPTESGHAVLIERGASDA